jgi:hypothetical protein
VHSLSELGLMMILTKSLISKRGDLPRGYRRILIKADQSCIGVADDQ